MRGVEVRFRARRGDRLRFPRLNAGAVPRPLKELTSEMHLALAFISHDLPVIRSICQRVVVMRDGRVVEKGRAIGYRPPPPMRAC